MGDTATVANVSIDTTPPQISPAMVAPTYVQRGGNPVVTTTLTDTLSGVGYAQVEVGELQHTGFTSTWYLSSQNGHYMTSMPVAMDADEGRKPLTIRAWDKMRNMASRADDGFVVDGTPRAGNAGPGADRHDGCPVHHRHDVVLQPRRQRPVPGVGAGRR